MTVLDFKSDPTFLGETKEKAVPASKNNTDVVALDFKLYIEGIQVPFESISISQVYTGKPTADIQIPPQSGLLDIIRGYEPKVHIFFEDKNYGGYRLLFWGNIVANSYSWSRAEGNSYITFRCIHKNNLVAGVTLDFTGWASPTNQSQVDPNSNSASKPGAFSSSSMIVQALEGIEGVAPLSEAIREGEGVIDKRTSLLDPSLEKLLPRLQGMPGAAVNLWNQIRRGAYAFPKDNFLLTKVYIPLVDEGIGYFKRMSGHPTLEARLQGDKTAYCNKRTYKETDIIIPPAFRNPFASAVQTELAVRSISNFAGFSGELTTFDELLEKFYSGGCEYDILTLASPAEIAADPDNYVDEVNKAGIEKSTIETIIKPKIPFYYSPTCNVLLPRMYSTISISQDETAVPTRIAAQHDAMVGQGGPDTLTTSFKAPASFREAVAYNAYLKDPTGKTETGLDLKSTMGLTFLIPSKYELGRGVRQEQIYLPWWLVAFASDKSTQGPHPEQEKLPETGSEDYNDLLILAADWKKRHGIDLVESDGSAAVKDNVRKNGLNPYDPLNTAVMPHERILFATADYEYSKRVFTSRNGQVQAEFNPYIIPGYPMDIINDSPNHPSFHGFCVSVTHTISARFASTSISFTNAVSYAELSNYYIPPLPPFLNTALGLVNGEIDSAAVANSARGGTDAVKSISSVLIQNPKAKEQADTFYREVLGVGAAAPDDLIHFPTNRAYPLQRKAGVLVPQVLPDPSAAPALKGHVHRAREIDDYYTFVGNSRMTSRPIESKESIEKKFQYQFIDIDPKYYNGSFVNYVNPKLAANIFLEPGASLFLDYKEINQFIEENSNDNP